MGYAIRKGYRFDRATHPQERLCWRMAAIAFERLRQTEVLPGVTHSEITTLIPEGQSRRIRCRD